MGMDTCLCPICGGKARKEEGIIGNFDNKKVIYFSNVKNVDIFILDIFIPLNLMMI